MPIEAQRPINITFVATSLEPPTKGQGRALGPETLASYLKKTTENLNMTMVDLQLEKNPDATIYALEQNPDIDILALSVRYGTFSQFKRILESLNNSDRVNSGQLHVIVGNVMPSFLAEKLVTEYPWLVVGKGEGELTLQKYLEAIQDHQNLENVPGITFFNKETQQIITNKGEYLPKSITSSPNLAFPEYIKNILDKEGVIWVSSSSGCPWDCTFCSVATYRKFTGIDKKSRWEPRPMQDVLGELQELYTLGAKKFVFADDEMLVGIPAVSNFDRWNEIADGIQKIGPDIKYQVSVRSDMIWNLHDTPEIRIARETALTNLIKSGLSQVYIGFESGSNTQLKRYQKGESVESHQKAIETLRKLALESNTEVIIGGGFIMFDSLMTFSEIIENINFIRDSKLVSHGSKDFIGDVFDMIRVQEGSRYKQILKEKGLLGNPIPDTLFYNYKFQDSKVEQVALTCIKSAAELDDFFEALKYTVFAQALEEQQLGHDLPEARILNWYLIELRLNDLQLLENLSTYHNNATIESRDQEPQIISNFRISRNKLLSKLRDDLLNQVIKDQTIQTLLLEHLKKII